MVLVTVSEEEYAALLPTSWQDIGLLRTCHDLVIAYTSDLAANLDPSMPVGNVLKIVSSDVTGPFSIESIHSNKHCLVFIVSPFTYTVKSKDKFPKHIHPFLIDFRELF